MSKCFVIMPFSGTRDSRHDASYWDKFYQNFLKPSVEELGYICERSVASSRNIVGTIIDDLFDSDIVLAILTDFNPNVLYELGVRHSLAHGTIMAIEKGQPIPFDLSQFGVVQYQEVDRAHFVQELERHIRDQRRRPVPDNPVAEHLRLKVGMARMTNNVADSPLDTAGALRSANRNVLIVGQNLYGLATNHRERDRIFEALSGKPTLEVRIVYADSGNDAQVKALSDIIDEAMPSQFPEIDGSFLAWCAEWHRLTSESDNRLEIRRCKRVGNVSATLVDWTYPVSVDS